jgi:Serine aminopeptidase, S33
MTDAETVPPHAQAWRVEPGAGFRDVTEFFGSGPERLFGAAHLPEGGADVGVLFCSSLNHDLLNNYRREVLLARALARHGVAVQRFQYRGTANSDGDVRDITFEAMVDDATEAAARLRELSGAQRLVLLGTRFGALVAATVSARNADVPVVLLEPAVDGRRFFRAAIRAKLMQSVADRSGQRVTTADRVAELERDGVLDVLGFELGHRLYDSAQGRDLSAELRAGATRPVLLLELTEDGELRPELAGFRDSLLQAGWPVDCEVIAGQENWWFLDETELFAIGAGGTTGEPAGAAAIIAAVLRWLDHNALRAVAS